MSGKDSELKALKQKNDILQKTVKGYEKVLQLSYDEITNLEQIIKMYESMIEYSRQELLDARESIKASELLRDLSRDELIKAFTDIDLLVKANAKFKKEKKQIRNQ